MSDFKFACPVCGQHITCDSGSSGSHMDCPTCFRKLIVPQAPAPGASGFVLTASEANKRTAVLPSYSVPKTAVAAPKKSSVTLIIISMVIFVLLAMAAVFVLKQKRTRHLASTDPSALQAENTNAPVVAAVVLPLASPDATNWTLNLEEAKIPDSPASGSVNGYGFNIERAGIFEGKLDLRQGPKWPPDTGISIHLRAKKIEDIAGKTVVIQPDWTNAPKVILRWKKQDGKAATREFTTGYAARIKFGEISGKWLSGTIFIATPDEAKSYASGSFNAEIRKPAPPKKKP